MFVSRFVEFAFRKAVSLAFVGLLVTASFAQNAAPQSTPDKHASADRFAAGTGATE